MLLHLNRIDSRDVLPVVQSLLVVVNSASAAPGPRQGLFGMRREQNMPSSHEVQKVLFRTVRVGFCYFYSNHHLARGERPMVKQGESEGNGPLLQRVVLSTTDDYQWLCDDDDDGFIANWLTLLPQSTATQTHMCTYGSLQRVSPTHTLTHTTVQRVTTCLRSITH